MGQGGLHFIAFFFLLNLRGLDNVTNLSLRLVQRMVFFFVSF